MDLSRDRLILELERRIGIKKQRGEETKLDMDTKDVT
jgi:hypothetical protein